MVTISVTWITLEYDRSLIFQHSLPFLRHAGIIYWAIEFYDARQMLLVYNPETKASPGAVF
jgi:hypothetical protein